MSRIKVHMKGRQLGEFKIWKLIWIKIQVLLTGTRSLVGKASALEKPRTWVRVLASVWFFHFFRCVLSSVLPLRSVGRSNFDKGLLNLATLIKKRHILMKTAVLHSYVYMYGIVIFHICMSLFESTLLSFCKPQSKLDLPTLRQGSRERKNATEQIKNMTHARTYMYMHTCMCIHMYVYT